MVRLEELMSSAGKKAGSDTDLPVYSVTKHAGFVPSLEYFKKQVFSRDVEGYKLVEPGNFAYATIHLDEGSIGIAPERALISPMYTVFVADAARVDSAYLLRYLKSPRALAQYERLGRGAIHRRKAIALSALGELRVPLPPLDEQRRIAAILDQADELRAKRRQVLAHLDSLTQSIFYEMFGQGSFDRMPASTFMPTMRNGLSPATAGSHEAMVLTLSAVTQGGFDPSAVKVGTFASEPAEEKRVAARDFLMCRGNGNKDLVGVGTFSREDRSDLVFPDTVIAGRADPELVEMTFLEIAWRQRDARAQIEAGARTTNGTYKVNQKTLGAVTIPIPPLGLQREFVAKASSVARQRDQVQTCMDRDDELFASLQARAFNGEL